MKLFVLAFLFLFYTGNCFSQNKTIDSLNRLIANATSDTQRINISITKLNKLDNINLDSAIVFGNKIIEEAKRINYKLGEARARVGVAGNYSFKGKYDTAKQYLDISEQILSKLEDSSALANMYNTYGFMNAMQNKFSDAYVYFEKAAILAKQINDLNLLRSILQNTAIVYQQQSNYSKALEYYQKALALAEQMHNESGAAYIYLNIALTYNSLDDNIRAEKSFLKAIELAKKMNLRNVEAYAYANIATLYGERKQFKKEYDFAMKAAVLGEKMGDKGIQASSLSRAALALANQTLYKKAEALNIRALRVADSSGQPYNIYQVYSNMGRILTMRKLFKRAIPYFEKAFHQLTDADLYNAEISTSYTYLSECYEETGNFGKALSAYKISAKIADSVRGRENIRKATELTLNYEFDKKQQRAEAAQEVKDAIADKIKTRQYFIIAALAIIILSVLIIVFIQFRNNKQKYKANLLLGRQKLKAENALSDLKSAQAQLIQSEKMASLGELTAGIAHEIQNPLNFVNNFSEINTELIEEVVGEIVNGNIPGANLILHDIKENSEKINHHGKRAGAIVKGMLQHTKASAGKKEPTDVNALVNEYLQLSYHGMRAKDKGFNVEMKTDFDSSLSADEAGNGKINIIPQEMGRVLLNLFNNALYAVSKKRKLETLYEPIVSISTKKSDNKVLITISDNGNGIPEKIKDKIFQPFFTTKPSGQGTGLGLSLSYDIVKAHGGEIKLETKEGEGAEFVISLPAS